MNIYAISAIVNVIVAMFIGGVIWRRGEDRLLVNTLGLFSLTLAIWSFGYVFWQLAPNANQALFWSRFLMMGAIFVSVTFFHFALVFLDKLEKYKRSLYVGYVLMTIFAAANFTDYFVAGVKSIMSFPYWPDPGILFHPFLAIWLFYALFAVYLLLQAYASAKERKDKIWYILAGIIATYVGGGANYFPWYGIEIPPVGTISASLFQILVAYAAARHQLFNMKIVITEFLSWVLVSILFLRVLLSETVDILVVNIATFMGVAVFAYFLVTNIYKEVAAREEAQQLTAELKKTNKEKSSMLSIASHQFRSPLTSIKGYASMMKDGSYGSVPDYLEKPVDRILQSSQKLAHVVDDFLNISRIEDGRMEYNFKEVNLGRITKETVQESQGGVDESRQSLRFETDGHDSYPAAVDISKFQQVITNLVDNAIKYTKEGEVVVRIKRDDPYIKIEVEDDGIGIDPDDAEEIFEQFSRADKAQEVNVSGSGLGLYIARKIVEAHDGEIWATSPGDRQGSTFHVQVPMADNLME